MSKKPPTSVLVRLSLTDMKIILRLLRLQDEAGISLSAERQALRQRIKAEERKLVDKQHD